MYFYRYCSSTLDGNISNLVSHDLLSNISGSVLSFMELTGMNAKSSFYGIWCDLSGCTFEVTIFSYEVLVDLQPVLLNVNFSLLMYASFIMWSSFLPLVVKFALYHKCCVVLCFIFLSRP